MDLNIALELLRNVLKEPANERHRQVMVDHINNEWIGKYHAVYLVLVKGSFSKCSQF